MKRAIFHRLSLLPVLVILAVLCVPLASADVRINEFMSSNGTTIADEDGDYEDWIELVNTGSEVVDLEGWGLSDNADHPFKWVFPEGASIAPGEFLLVWASGKDRASFYTPDWANGYVAEAAGLWLLRSEDDGVFADESPNEMNGQVTGEVEVVARGQYAGAVRFGENGQIDLGEPFVLDGDFTVSYWIRPERDGLYRVLNSSESATLTMGHMNPSGMRFWNPTVNVALSRQVPAGEWTHVVATRSGTALEVYVNGELAGAESWNGRLEIDRLGGLSTATIWDEYEGKLGEVLALDRAMDATEVAELHELQQTESLHSNFRISSAGEPLSLTRTDGSTADAVPPVYVPRDVSFGRLGDGGEIWHYFADTTPGRANSATPVFLPPAVSVSEPRGFRTEPFTVSLSTPDAAATIRYTLDGSTPGPESPVYTSPIEITGTTTLRASAIEPGMIELPPETVTWLFLDDVLEQDATPPPGWPADREVNNHRMDYGMRPDIVTNDNERLRQGMMDIPSISLVTDLGHLFNPMSDDLSLAGIYSNSDTTLGEERPVSIELIDPSGDFLRQFQIDGGLRLRGGFSRTVNNPKHSFRLFFRSAYGDGTLDFPLFEDEGADEFHKVDLRTAQNYSWSFANDVRNTFLREVFSRDTQGDMGLPYTRSRYYHLYINGQYWGLYMTQERGESDWAATYLGGDSQDWDTIKTGRPGYVTRPSDGNMDAFHTLHEITVNEGFSGVHADNYWRVRGLNPDGTPNPDFPKYVDQDNLILFMLIAHYTADPDSPVSIWGGFPNNLYGLFNRKNPDGFKWLRHDAEHSLGAHRDYDFLADTTAAGSNLTSRNTFNPGLLHWKLAEHPEYRMRVADLVQRHMHGSGALSPDSARARVLERKAQIDLAIIGESARWGRGRTRDTTWLPAVEVVLAFVAQRREFLLDAYRNRGWFPSINAPSGQSNRSTLLVTSEVPFYYMTNESDPRLTGGGIHPEAVLVDEAPFAAELPVALAASLKARGYLEGEWSALLDGDATFTAMFEPSVRLHEWDFEDEGDVLAHSYTLGGAGLEVVPGSATEVLSNTGGEFATRHLRVNNPLGAEVVFSLPTTGYGEISLDLLTRRSGQGAGVQTLSYTLDGVEWVELESYEVFNEPPQARTTDFSGVAGVADNPDFAVRIEFARSEAQVASGDEEGVGGNHRFDDVALWGLGLPGTKVPPSVVAAPEMGAPLVESGGMFSLALAEVFLDPNGDELDFQVMSSRGDVVSAVVVDGMLVLEPLRRGVSDIWLSASDGVNPLTEVAFEVEVRVESPWHAGLSAESLGHWLMEAGEGATLADHSPAGNDGVISGGVNWGERGDVGGALDFEPSGQVDLGEAVAMAGDFTASYWFRTRRGDFWRALNNSESALFSAGHFYPANLRVWDPTADIDLSQAFLTGMWEHVVWSRQGGQLRVYRNGMPVGEVAWPGSLSIDRLGGLSGNTVWSGYDGWLGEVMLLDRAMEADEVGMMHAVQAAGGVLAAEVMHEWNFEEETSFWEPSASVSVASVELENGGASSLQWNDEGQGFSAAHLRVNNPAGSALVWSLPTNGYEAVAMAYETRRSGQGAGLQRVYYTVDGVAWEFKEEIEVFNEDPQPVFLNFTGDEGVANNRYFAVRIEFVSGSGGTGGNNRFDNVEVSGLPRPGTNQRPELLAGLPSSLSLVAGEAAVAFDLDEWFEDPEGEVLEFTAESSQLGVLSAAVVDGVLLLDGVAAGEALVVVSADDGVNPAVEVEVRVLVYPEPHALASGEYLFGEWDAVTPAGEYPPHMIFLQGEEDDSSLTTDLNRAYHIPADDASEPEDADFPYAATARTRINGLGEDGISFINTGRGRDLGGALLALDTTGVDEARVGFLAGTVLENLRIYAIRLQYRIGTEGPFLDMVYGEDSPMAGQVVEYVRQGDGHVQPMGPVSLPAELIEQPNVQLLWRYCRVSGDNGARAQLRLDDILVDADTEAVPSDLVFDQMPSAAQSGGTLEPTVVRVLDEAGFTATGFGGEVTISLLGAGSLSGTLTVNAVAGVAVFDDLVLSGAGAHQLEASADGLDAIASDEFRVVEITELVLPRFIQGDQDADNNNEDRVPYAFRLQLDGLRPNATYRFGNRVVLATDAPDNNGAGNAIYITGASADWVRSTSAPRFREDDLGNRHWTFATDAEGSYTGWFVTEPTGNARFAPGNELHMRLLLNDGQGGEDTAHILTTESSATVMRFGSGVDEGTGLVGQTSAAARRMVVLYDETAGSTRPLAATPVEITGSEVDDRYVTFYETVVATNPNHWGTIIPNDLPGGVQRIEVLGLTSDAILDLRVDGDGLEGTLDPDTGTTPILLDAGAGLPRFLPGGNGSWNDAVNWSTQSVPDGDGQSAILNAPIGGNRAVTLDVPVTVGNLRVEQEGSAFRNRINSAGEIESLTFANDGQPAQMRVLGNGQGFVEFNLDAPVELADTLRVIVDHLGNEADDAFGGLRLRGTWQGTGGLIKQGVGIASLTGDDKDFEGAIVIEQGALRITEPAVPWAVSGVTVLEGGQLRLVSGSSPGEPRIHTFGGGAIELAGLGRGGDLPGGEELGVLGALRYDPSNNDNHAILTNEVVLNGDTDIHTDGTRNLLEIQGAVGGTGKLIKTGGGALRLSADSPGFGEPMEVEKGLLEVDGDMGASAVVLGGNGVLGGGGEVGAISGAGSVEPATARLTAPQSGAVGYAFVFESPGATAVNGTLELTATPALTTAPDQIGIYLNVAELVTGDVFQGGLLVDDTYDLEAVLSGTTVNLFVAEEEGGVAYRGGEYRAAEEGDELSWSVADTAEGRLIEVRVGLEVSGFEAWRGDHFTAAELADETVSGPEADPSGMGVPNLMRYALGLGRDDVPWSSLPELTDPPTDAFRFPFDPEKTDITYRVLASADLVDWSEVIFDSSEPFTLEPENGHLEVPIDSTGPRRFFRLEVER